MLALRLKDFDGRHRLKGKRGLPAKALGGCSDFSVLLRFKDLLRTLLLELLLLIGLSGNAFSDLTSTRELKLSIRDKFP